MRTALSALSLVPLLFGACASPMPTGPTPVPETTPAPAATPAPAVLAVFTVEGAPVNDECLPPARGFRAWRVVVADAGDGGMDINATVTPSADASCEGPFTTEAARMRGWQTIAPRAAGEAVIALEHMNCGSARYTLWNGDVPVARFRLNTGIQCYPPIR